MLTVADLEVNVLDFRQRSFQFERLAEVGGTAFAVFSRTETETERQLRPKLLRLTVVAPLPWVVLDATTETLRISKEGRPPPAIEALAVEVAAEPSEFDEEGQPWRRAELGPTAFVYVPAAHAAELLGPEGRSRLGLG